MKLRFIIRGAVTEMYAGRFHVADAVRQADGSHVANTPEGRVSGTFEQVVRGVKALLAGGAA